MKKNRFFQFIASSTAILGVFIASMFFSSMVHADGWGGYSGGGQVGTGGGGSSSDPSIICMGPRDWGTTHGMDRCPHWTLVSSSYFSTMWADGYVIGSGYSEEAKNFCTSSANNPSGIVIMSAQNKSKAYGTITLHNYNFPSPNFRTNYKVAWHQFAKDAINHADSEYYNFFGDNMPGGNMPDGSYKVSDGTILRTYEDGMNYILGVSGLSEAALAFWCPGMLDKPDDDTPVTTYYTQSNVSIDGDYAMSTIGDNPGSASKEKTVEVGTSVAIVFSHNVFASKSDADNISWSVSRSYSFSLSGSAGYTSGTMTSWGTHSSGKFIGSPRNNSDGTNQYASHSSYTTTFSSVGTYTFCETITAGSASSKSCATIKVKNTPPPPDPGSCPINDPTGTATISSGTSTTASAVVDWNNTNYNSWASSHTFIYAKPTDKVQYTHCLYSGAQAVRHSSSHGNHNSDGSSSSNGDRDAITATSNKMTVNGFSLWNDKTFTYTRGETKLYSETSNKYTVKDSDVGTNLSQSSYANIGSSSSSFVDNSWTYYVWTVNGCTRTVSDGTDEKGNPKTKEESYDCYIPHTAYHSSPTDYYSGSNGGASTTVTATAYVPYNFTTSTKANIVDQTERVYSGETANATVDVQILQRYNATTQGTYVTKTPSDTEVRLVSFYLNPGESSVTGSTATSAPCSHYSGTHNCHTIATKTASFPGGPVSFPATKALVDDVLVGSKFCVAVGISHTDSKNDTNDNGAGTVSSYWNVSNATCRVVAKKPAIQVWGGSTYSAGSIVTSTSPKSKVSATSLNSHSDRIFGSWTEHALIIGNTGATAKGFSSGAALGFALGNSSGSSFCSRSPLTIANNKACENSQNYANGAGVTSNPNLREQIRSRFQNVAASKGKNCGTSINLASTSCYYDDGVNGYRYTYVGGNATITGAPILTNGATFVIYATGNITIDTNLLYENNPYISGQPVYGYTSIYQVPQYLIISDKNIYIKDSVTQIDAWLIAGGTIDTCTGHRPGSGFSANTCTNQLVINGSVIAKNLSLNRTYGAGTGYDSAVAAEVINFSPSTYLWAYAQATDYPQAYVTYMRQLAPRF